MVYCGDTCYFWDNKNCVERRNCVCTSCAGLRSLSPTLYEDCASACNSQDANLRPKSKDDFLCGIGGDQLWGRYHIIGCGFDPTRDSYEGKMAANATSSLSSKIVIGLLIAAIIFLIIKLFR